MPGISDAPDINVLKYELPLAKTGEAAAASSVTGLPLDADHRPGNLRVHIIEAEGLAMRADGTPCRPYATITIAELTRRRTRRVAAGGVGPSVQWGEAFDFEDTSACAQVVVDVWDKPSDAPADLLGKALLSLSDCRCGVPHTYFKHLLEGKLVLRVLFDFDQLPPLEEEIMQYEASYQAAMKATGAR